MIDNYILQTIIDLTEYPLLNVLIGLANGYVIYTVIDKIRARFTKAKTVETQEVQSA